MEIFGCGTNFPHNTGEFCMNTIRDSFFISCFSTPFLYESDGRMLAGNAGDIRADGTASCGQSRISADVRGRLVRRDLF